MKPIVLAILDGFGYRKEKEGNAIALANTPNIDSIIRNFPHSLLDASGTYVGLPDGQMGNSEVGHLNIGAGRIVYQPLALINKKIEDKTFYSNAKFLNVIDHVKKNGSSIHLIGLLSDGGVHSHINHLFALLKLCKIKEVSSVYIHIITDGRDTLPSEAKKYISLLNSKIEELNIGVIASISGRYYAMDRDNRWERIQKYYDTIISGKNYTEKNILEYVDDSFNNEVYDEFIVPALFDKNGIIKDNDGIIMYNFRSDRINQILTAITNNKFEEFKRVEFQNIKLTTMMNVRDTVVCDVAFTLEQLNNTFGEWISKAGLKQLRIAETEKYNHVTYFFDGNKNIDYRGEKKILIESPKVKTYDLAPEMSAKKITNTLLNELDNNEYDYVILNFANGDMVGHTGVLSAAISAVETVDECIGKIYNKIQEKHGLLVITADHGNSEYMIDEDGNPYTAHTTNKVPFIVCSTKYKLKNGKLADIIPTIFKINNLNIPSEMTGDILIEENI